MCEATAYVISNGKEKEVMKDVVTVDVQGKRLLFRDILGNEKRLSAQIKKIDLLQHKVTVVELQIK
ncbi:MAG: CooT family nickel-binding protein [Chloroflexi bacterium]|nr:CooT family nickel-binding protein [Chloroflexota bacterium]